MNKITGIHFYINIVNFNNIILDEEAKTKEVTHSIHALDTFFSTIGNNAPISTLSRLNRHGLSEF